MSIDSRDLPRGIIDPTGGVAGIAKEDVYATGAVSGAVVKAYAYDPATGQPAGYPDSPLVTSAPTSADGRFHIELGARSGRILLEARGVGATYTEPATGTLVMWEPSTALRAYFVRRTPGGISLEFPRGAKCGASNPDCGPFVIDVFTDLTSAYAPARFAHKRDATFDASLGKAYASFRDHLSYDFWTVVPSDLSSGGPRAFDDTMIAGGTLAGLSNLIRMADETDLGSSGHNMLSLEPLLIADITGGHAPPPVDQTDKAVFDGFGAAGPLALGPCPGGVGAVMSTAQAGTTASPLAMGGRLRVGYGLSDLFEIGAASSYVATGRRIRFAGAMVDGQPGALGADISAFEIGADLRMNLGALLVPRLSRLRPVVGLRSGLLVRMIGSSVLVDDAQNAIPTSPQDETNALPFLAASGGLEYRFGPSLVFGVMADYAYAGESYKATSLLAELGWLRY